MNGALTPLDSHHFDHDQLSKTLAEESTDLDEQSTAQGSAATSGLPSASCPAGERALLRAIQERVAGLSKLPGTFTIALKESSSTERGADLHQPPQPPSQTADK